MKAEPMSRGTRLRRALLLLVGGTAIAWLSYATLHQHLSGDRPPSPAIGALRTIASVQEQFREGDREGDGFLDYASSLAELSSVGFIDSALGTGEKSGFLYSLSGGTYHYRCSATPVNYDYLGTRNFTVCTDGMVRFSRSRVAATCSSAAVE